MSEAPAEVPGSGGATGSAESATESAAVVDAAVVTASDDAGGDALGSAHALHTRNATVVKDRDAMAEATPCRPAKHRAMKWAVKTLHLVSFIAVGSLATATGCDAPPEPTPDTAVSSATTKPATTASIAKPARTLPPRPTARPEPVEEPGEAKGPFPASTHEALKDPSKANEKAPAKFNVKFDTTQGEFELECTRDWAPKAADRFYNLVKIGFYDDTAFFRVAKKPKPFVVQWGIHGDPEVSKGWKKMTSEPDPVKESNKRGTMVFAMGGNPKSFTTQVFINFSDNARLDGMGFAPVCKVVAGMDETVEKLHFGYGEAPSSQQGRIEAEGNAYLRKRFKQLDYIKTARLAGDAAKDDKKADDKKAAPSTSASPSAATAKPTASPAPTTPPKP